MSTSTAVEEKKERPVKSLHHAISKEKVEKTTAGNTLTAAYHIIQKPDLFNGMSKVYQPKADPQEKDVETLPPDLKRIQVHTTELISGVQEKLTSYFDVTAQRDYANCRAKADVIVDGKVLLPNVPATYLLFLEKQLVDVQTFIKKLPTHDLAEHWTFDPSQGHYATGKKLTNRTKKVRRNHRIAAATDKHPEQVEVYTEDVVVGSYEQTNFTSALPVPRVQELLARVEKLRTAVKDARETANMTAVEDVNIGGPLFAYLFEE